MQRLCPSVTGTFLSASSASRLRFLIDFLEDSRQAGHVLNVVVCVRVHVFWLHTLEAPSWASTVGGVASMVGGGGGADAAGAARGERGCERRAEGGESAN